MRSQFDLGLLESFLLSVVAQFACKEDSLSSAVGNVACKDHVVAGLHAPGEAHKHRGVAQRVKVMRSEITSMGLFMSRIPATKKPQLARGSQKWIVRGPTGELRREKILDVAIKVSVIRLLVGRCLEVGIIELIINLSDRKFKVPTLKSRAILL